ncbi:epoxide hydrolase 4-like [Anthonomus grandis grandis]|uniref:epoxide hydrolase 4-like n=1 Tax=Anthonomus grandis grandis TaxID=2921223 RepID=UPI002165EAB8|nr:epoxide hydrolase 4-like [Anthonomus grandis grandis]
MPGLTSVGIRKMAKKAESCIQPISVYGIIRIHILSFVFGIWVLCKKLLKWIWDPQACGIRTLRDTPPSLLVDSSIGQHKHLKLKGVKLHYVEAGPKDKPLVLLLHGFPDFWLSWRYQIPALAEQFHVVALDLRGFGDSDKPAWRTSYKIEIILEELSQFIYSLGDNSCILIGHDLGALLGWYLIHENPSIVSKFVAVSCPHPNVYWQTFNSSYNYQWLNFVQLPYLPEIDALKEDVKIIEQYHKHLPAKDVHLEAYKYTFSRKQDWTGPINYYRNLPFFKISEKLEHIEIPVVLITGSKDQYVSLEGIIRSTEYCEKFRLKVIEDCGHFPHQENPEMFNSVLLKYITHKNTNEIKNILTYSPSKRLINGLFGAVSNTVKIGNSVIGSMQKKTNDVVNSIPSFTLSTSPSTIMQ